MMHSAAITTLNNKLKDDILYRMLPIKFHEETRLQGIPISDGIVHAQVCLFNERRHSNLPV